MQNEYLEIQDVNEDEFGVSFTAINNRKKFLLVHANKLKQITIAIAPNQSAFISWKKESPMWLLWKSIKNEKCVCEEIETSIFCVIHAAHALDWLFLEAPSGEKVLAVKWAELETREFFSIPKEHEKDAVSFIIKTLLSAPIEKLIMDALDQDPDEPLSSEDIKDVQKCITETQRNILSFILILKKIEKECEKWETT